MAFPYNFHTHTKRCGHAIKDDEDYIISAIENGFTYLGFSDHTPINNVIDKKIRMNEDEIDEYISTILSLKEKYKDQIEIHIGLEVEYFPLNFDYVKSLLKNTPIEYLIIGQHFHMEKLGKFISYNNFSSPKDGLHQYIDDLINGIRSGIFLYIAHPDLFRYFYYYSDEIFYQEIDRLLKACQEYNIPLELNISKMANNIRRGSEMFENLPFPDEKFWDLVSEYDLDVILGLDAHDPKAFNDSPIKWALKFIEEKNLRLLDSEEILQRIRLIKSKNI